MRATFDRNANFSQITHLLRSNECTPEPTDDAEGIALNAPFEVGYSGTRAHLDPADTPFVVAGVSHFKYGTLGLTRDFPKAILFLVIDAATHRVHPGKMEGVRNAAPRPQPHGAVAPGLEITSYFNPNLAEVIQLPAQDADYLVYACLGPFQSNVLDVRVRRRGGGGSAWPT